jgi:hypothetical protein
MAPTMAPTIHLDGDVLRGDVTVCAPKGARAVADLRAALRTHGITLHGAIVPVVLDRSTDDEPVLIAPSTPFLVVLDGDVAHDADHAVDLLASLLRTGADLALSQPSEDGPFDAMAARFDAWAPLEGGFVGIDRIIDQGAWQAGVTLVRNGESAAVALASLDRGRHAPVGDHPRLRRVLRNPLSLIVAFLAVQAGFVLGDPRSPFTDESIYVVMGQRALGGFTGDGFLSWVTGSRLYPAVAASVSAVGGHIPASLLSAVLVAGVAMICGRAARHLDRPELEYPTVAAVLVPGVMFWFGHQISHDLGVLVGLAAALWCISRYHVTQRRSRLAWAGLAAGAAGLSAYAGFLMAIPLLLLALQVTGWRQWKRTAPFIFAFAFPVALYALRYLTSLQALQVELERQSPGLVVPRDKVLAQLFVFGVVPAILCVLGLRRSTLPWLTRLIMLGAFVLLPAVHVVTSVEQASNRHLAYGIPLASPLLGAGLLRIVRSARGHLSTPRIALCAVALVPIGVGQAYLLDRDWADIRPTLDYLANEVRVGDDVLTYHQWTVAEHLLENGNIDDPWAVYSPDRVAYGGEAPDVCELDWFVDDSLEPEMAPYRAAIEACGTFEVAFTQTAEWIRHFGGLTYEAREVTITVWRNGVADVTEDTDA